MKNALDYQVSKKEDDLEKEKNVREKEKEMLKYHWANEEKVATDLEREKLRQNKEKIKTFKDENIEIEKIKKAAIQKIKEEDIRMNNMAIEREE